MNRDIKLLQAGSKLNRLIVLHHSIANPIGLIQDSLILRAVFDQTMQGLQGMRLDFRRLTSGREQDIIDIIDSIAAEHQDKLLVLFNALIECFP